jgi:hypothetical protein
MPGWRSSMISINEDARFLSSIMTYFEMYKIYLLTCLRIDGIHTDDSKNPHKKCRDYFILSPNFPAISMLFWYIVWKANFHAVIAFYVTYLDDQESRPQTSHMSQLANEGL